MTSLFSEIDQEEKENRRTTIERQPNDNRTTTEHDQRYLSGSHYS